MQASSEEEREKERERERERERKKEEEKRIVEEINRWAEEFEEEFGGKERDEQDARDRAEAREVPSEVLTGIEVEDSLEAEVPLTAGSSRMMLEASGASEPQAPRVRAAPVPAALHSPLKKMPVERKSAKGAEPSKKKSKKPVVEEEEEEIWMEEWMVSVVASRRYEYIGYKDFEQEQGFQPREQEVFIKDKLEHHQWTQLAGLEEPARPEVIYQFNCNLNLEEEYTSKVRGVKIRWDVEAWNELLRLPH